MSEIEEEPLSEDPAFLTEQIITYIGNKRSLLDFIGAAVNVVKDELSLEKLAIADVFSGSGVVSRFFKRYACELYVNDLEGYCETINRCYLTDRKDVDIEGLEKVYKEIKHELDDKPLKTGFISELYSPKDDDDIKPGERVFFTSRNAAYIDTARQLIEQVPEKYRVFLLAALIFEASVHTNTSGVFKGFYKNSETGVGQFGGNGRHALQRIMADIELRLPVFSRFVCPAHIYREDAGELAKHLPPVDMAYIDPPYNQHPYGSNYFMLNLINTYKKPDKISKVSGIPSDWNKSDYNSRKTAKQSMYDICDNLDAKYLLISFNDDGFITRDEMVDMLSGFGDVRVFDKEYNTFRGCRNLSDRSIHVKELLYLVKRDTDLRKR